MNTSLSVHTVARIQIDPVYSLVTERSGRAFFVRKFHLYDKDGNEHEIKAFADSADCLTIGEDDAADAKADLFQAMNLEPVPGFPAVR